jgi:hypothetical protein
MLSAALRRLAPVAIHPGFRMATCYASLIGWIQGQDRTFTGHNRTRLFHLTIPLHEKTAAMSCAACPIDWLIGL